MLSTALRNGKHDGASDSLSGRSSARARARAAEKISPHLKAVSAEPDAHEAEVGLGDDVAGLPLGRIPETADDASSGAAPASESAAPAVEPSLSDYSTIGAYLHEL